MRKPIRTALLAAVDADARRTLPLLLANAGIDLLAAVSDGVSAEKALMEYRSDLLVLQANLPLLDGVSLKSFGSQGQVRTAAVSLKLAQRTMLQKASGETPVLLLDDVLSELDPARQDFVLNQITGGQVFITCCEPGKLTQLGKTIQIENGNIK